MNDAIRSIVAGVGRTDELDSHFQASARLAGALGVPLHAVHAYRLPDPIYSPYPEIGAYAPDVMQAAVEAAGRRLEAQIETVAGGAQILPRTVAGPADMAVVEVAEEVGAGLIIVGATERGAVSRTLLGTTAGRVVRNASVPVLVDSGSRTGPARRVLITTDLSEHSEAVYRRALPVIEALSEGAEAEIRVLLVAGDDLTVTEKTRDATFELISEREIRPFLERADPGAAGRQIRVRMGDAATEIAAEAEEWGADLLVLGTHGRGGMTRLLIGSVAEAVVRRPPCDVLVIPNDAVELRNEAA